MAANTHYSFKKDAPLLWLSPDEAIFGVDKTKKKIEIPTFFERAILTAINRGCSHYELKQISKKFSVQLVALEEFIEKISSVIVKTQIPPVKHSPLSSTPRVSVIGAASAATIVAKSLSRARYCVVLGAPQKNGGKQIIISVDRFHNQNLRLHELLFAGHKIMPIRFSDEQILIGPVTTKDYEFLNVVENWETSYPIENKHLSYQVADRATASEETHIEIVSGFIVMQLEKFLSIPQQPKSVFVLTVSKQGFVGYEEFLDPEYLPLSVKQQLNA